jgi:hypothetical protein
VERARRRAHADRMNTSITHPFQPPASASLRSSGVPTGVAARLRTATVDDDGNAVEFDDQIGPCRHCLRYSSPGERLALVAYSPFEQRNAYRESGPIFVHADGCARFDGAGIPPAFEERPIVLRGYDAQQRMVRADVVVGARTSERAAAMFADPGVAWIHARSITHGCWLFRIDRA